MSHQHQQSQKLLEHFALIYVDREGNLRHEVSASIFAGAQSILSPQVTGAFLKAVAESRTDSFPEPPDNQVVRTTVSLAPNVPREAEKRAIEPKSWRARTEERDWYAQTAISPITAQLPINQSDPLRRYYEKVFQNLQQANCRIIAKTYIRLAEPHKQARYPYNGRKHVQGKTQQFNPEETKPPWWPIGVTHREPDHLPKSERIALLIHILCELRISHGITARKLKNAGRLVQNKIIPFERLELLDELYRVREEEEKLLDAVTGIPQSPYQEQTCPRNFPRTPPRTYLRINLMTLDSFVGQVTPAVRSRVVVKK
ncbi:hypothetical protein N7456_007113 [Penicillium angulare]|uniref:Subtelomeric hrmA-associated cluster protein AFUB-079030/YDR124W-like helical bundle domain-containing protein n=1 Tax=Penicillium angulare TaxID=116970 RepID=A0A9W9FIX0_9EURO|nr:hypothetical protein N7456_007113 [Penicillium angulare]